MTSELYVDGGYSPSGLVSLEELSALSGASALPIVRLETLAEAVLGSVTSPREFSGAFRDALAAESVDAVGLKSIAAYRYGLGLSPSIPEELEVRHAVEREFSLAQARGVLKISDPTLLSFLVHQALAEINLPIQFHVGFGDPDLQLDRVNPALLTPVIRRAAYLGRQIVLLHCYPYHREAAYLSHVFANVSFDLGLTLNFVGGAGSSVLAEAMELAPFSKLLYSSDAYGLPELHALGSSSFRTAVGAFFNNLVQTEQVDLKTAQRFIDMVAFGNSRRVYQT
jgi:predicted TIM-barrel fold metal-dependent hydrolase